MSKVHTVRQGECLSSIAKQYGLMSWRALYDHPDNESLKSLRDNPNVIYPGDKVVIPETPIKTINAQTDTLHKFQVKGEPTFLRLNVLMDSFGEGAVGSYSLSIEGLKEPIEGELGEKGAIDVQIPAQAKSAILLLIDKESGESIETFELAIGDLDPIETTSGVQARLNALGYYQGDTDNILGEKTEEAIKCFQVSSEIIDKEEPYGKITIDKLLELYGA